MLVRDEADTLALTLPTIKPHIHHWTIVDTGSLDNTPAAVHDLLGDIPGTLHHKPWVGFAHNRTELLELAANTCDYHLCLDADLQVDMPVPIPTLTRDAYNLTFAGDFQMSLPLLLKDGRRWEWKGVTHSYLDMPTGTTTGNLIGLTLTEIRANSPRDDKIQQDARLLEADISPRTIHYLAQSYRDLGFTREAADLYRFRIRLSAENPEEVFWSCYQEGIARCECDGLAAGTAVLLEAHQRRPWRAEPLWKLAREYRLAGQTHVALLFAEKAAALPMPDEHGFVLRWVYEWGAPMELALVLRALGRHQESLDLFRRLDALGLDGEPGQFFRDQIHDLAPVEVPA